MAQQCGLGNPQSTMAANYCHYNNWQWAETTATKIIDKGPKQKRGNRRTVCFAQCRTLIQSPLQRKITTANLFSRKSKFVFPNSSRGWSGCVGLRANPRCRQHGQATAPTTIATCRRPPSPSWDQAQCSWSKTKSKLGNNLSLNLDQDLSLFSTSEFKEGPTYCKSQKDLQN